MKYQISILLILLMAASALGQNGLITGTISSEGERVPFANVQVDGTTTGTVASEHGTFSIEAPIGPVTLIVSLVGYEPMKQSFELSSKRHDAVLKFELKAITMQLNQVVVTGTRTAKKITDSPVMVNVIDSKTLTQVQACNLSEGLKFQPGLRVETDCQTCNYTQLRMNGLAGGYSQILINGRPIFSPLTGLYGMEQIPTNMIERIEVVRGGGSALYGSSAIGGTVNVITKVPTENSYSAGYTYQNTQGTNDHIIAGNATVLSPKSNAGISLFVNNRKRGLFDANGDNYSELPALETNAFGANLFYQPAANQKLEINLSSITEYRYGGEMVGPPAHLSQQSEERTHIVLVGNVDYQINFNQEQTSFIAYAAAQHTDRAHYTGIFPDDSVAIQTHLEAPPYGTSDNTTYQAGVQLNHRVKQFLFGGTNVLTAGAEFVEDDVFDAIEAYNYLIDQKTQNLGAFFQSDWNLTPTVTLLSGVRIDEHNLVDQPLVSPRFSLMYKHKSKLQLRATWGQGFRAPQAFDTDLHIAFAGGGISRVSLADNLTQERSNSFTGSVNYDKATASYVLGFTAEAFYTRLTDAFYLQPLGTDAFGERFEKRNGDAATVRGGTLEARANFNRKVQIEAGFTLQTSEYDTAVEYVEGLEAKKAFLRTPNDYGYATLSYTPNPRVSSSVNLVYTGTMQLAHFGGAPEQAEDVYVTSPTFTEISARSGYTFRLGDTGSGLEVFAGIRNLTNAYQSDFDSGKNRDSNYVYGPGLPRTYVAGIKLKSL